jgi:hypothetical protein
MLYPHPFNQKPALAAALGLAALAGTASGARVSQCPAALPDSARATGRATAAALKPPLAFEENRGQVASRARFLSRGPGHTLALSPTEAVVSLAGRQAVERSRSAVGSPQSSRLNTQHSLRLRLAGSDPRAKLAGLEKQPGIVNYLIGSDPKSWRTHIPTYKKVKYEGVYPGIDLVYHGSQGSLEYDFEVAPGADPSQVRLTAEGAEKVELSSSGDLLLHTPAGTLTQHKPVAYQLVDGKRHEIPAEFSLHPTPYALHPSREVSFQLARYDATRPLIIDPTLAFSTYLGGTGDDFGKGVAVDSGDAVYVTGYTPASDYPTVGAYDSGSNGGQDVFVTKLSSDGTSMVYSTYLGGSADDYGLDVAVGTAGEAAVTGYTSSTDFPTGSAYDGAANGGIDVFVTKLAADGASLVYSTYLGGSAEDTGRAIALGTDGAAYVTGQTFSSNFPTASPFDSALTSTRDAFAAKLSSDGQTLAYSTYLGGSGGELGAGIAVDSSGCAYVTGFTGSGSSYPAVNAFQDSRGIGAGESGTESDFFDAFVTKLAANGASLVYSTYLGGKAYDEGRGIAVDASGAAYVVGYTNGGFPTQNPYQASRAGSYDTFITKFAGNGTTLSYSTYLGGTQDDYGFRIAIDADGNAAVVGLTTSGFPTVNAYQASPGGTYDAFVSKLGSSGSSLVYSTYLGGSSNEGAYDVALNSLGNAVVAGDTFSSNHPLVNPVDTTQSGFEAFAARIDSFAAPTDLTVSEGPNWKPVLSWTDNSVEETGYTIERAGNDLIFSEVATSGASQTTSVEDSTATPGTLYYYRVRAYTTSRVTGYSSEVLYTPSTPTAPTGLSAHLNAAGTAIELTWTDASSNELSFNVQRSTDGGIMWDPGTSSAVNSTSASDSDIAGRSVILYRVAAVNGSGASLSSEVQGYVTPANLTATEGSSGKPVLSWDEGFSDETGFSLERQPLSTLSGFTQVLTTSANQTSNIEDTTATPGVNYEYRVRAIRPSSSTGYSVGAPFIATAPDAPSDLAPQTSASGTSVNLSWTDNSNHETSFVALRTEDGAVWDVVGTVSADTSSLVDPTTDPDTTYYYQVVASNDAGANGSGAVESSPREPSGLAAEAVSGSVIELSWTDNSWNEDGFELERKVGSGSYILLADLAPGTRSHRHTGLAENTTYTYRLRSYCESASGWAGPASAATYTAAPESPSSLKVYSPDRGSVVLTWMDNSGDESGFRISRRVGATGAYAVLGTASASSNTYSDSTTTGDTKYSYTVAAYNDRGVSAAAKEQSVTTMWGPESLTASAVTTAQIDLTWKDMTLYEDGYSIERRKGSGSYYEVGRAGGKVGKNQTLTYSDTGLTIGVSYTYRVRAYNSNATSLYATGSSITTTGAPAPGLRVTPVQKSFGRVPKGQARTATFQVKNAGKKREEVTLSALGGAFQIAGGRRFTLIPGASRTFKVRFSAGRVGSYQAELPVKCQHGEVVKIRLEGRSVRG